MIDAREVAAIVFFTLFAVSPLILVACAITFFK